MHWTPDISCIASKLKYGLNGFRNNSHIFKKISPQVRASHFTNLKFCACDTKIWCTSASNISPMFIAVSYKLGWRFFNFISSMVALETFTFFDLSPHFNIAHKIIFTFFSIFFENLAKLLISYDSSSHGALRNVFNVWFWKLWFSIFDHFCLEDSYYCSWSNEESLGMVKLFFWYDSN